MKKSALGRGLDALLGEVEEAYENESSQSNKIIELSLEDIQPNPYQPRKEFSQESLKELAESIKKDGLIQPILVFEESIDKYIIIAGERRYRASKLAKLTTIKAIVLDVTKEQLQQYALIENIQREDLNPIELAHSYESLIKLHNITHEELANYIHKSRAHITNTLRLLQLDPKAQVALIEKKISAGHAKMLVSLDKNDQKLLVDTIIGQKLSVRELENVVKGLKRNHKIQSKKTVKEEKKFDLKNLEESLKNYIKDVKTQHNKIILHIQDKKEIENLLEKLR